MYYGEGGRERNKYEQNRQTILTKIRRKKKSENTHTHFHAPSHTQFCQDISIVRKSKNRQKKGNMCPWICLDASIGRLTNRKELFYGVVCVPRGLRGRWINPFFYYSQKILRFLGKQKKRNFVSVMVCERERVCGMFCRTHLCPIVAVHFVSRTPTVVQASSVPKEPFRK